MAEDKGWRRYFNATKPRPWRRHVVWMHTHHPRNQECVAIPIARFWSWDKADDLAEILNASNASEGRPS